MSEEQIGNSPFVFMQVWGNYLYEYKHNTMEEITTMTYAELEARFREVTDTGYDGVEVV